jgi:hypothetical protein
MMLLNAVCMLLMRCCDVPVMILLGPSGVCGDQFPQLVAFLLVGHLAVQFIAA